MFPSDFFKTPNLDWWIFNDNDIYGLFYDFVDINHNEHIQDNCN